MDAHVIGCGPAGSFSAISLLMHGFSVTVSEKSRIGTPVRCSGLVSLNALRQIKRDFGIHMNTAIIRYFDRVGIIFDTSETLIRLKTNPLVLIDRKAFDLACAERAVSLGAELTCSMVRSRRDLKTNNVVAADGPVSTIAWLFGFPRTKYIYTRQIFIRAGNRCTIGNDTLSVYLSNRFRGLFGWFIPRDDTIELGVAVADQKLLDVSLALLLWRLGLKDVHIKSVVNWVLPQPRRTIGARFGKYNIFLVGDAAGHVKPLTGGGIFYGSRGALLIGKNLHSPEAYQREWDSTFGRELRIMAAARGVVERVLASGITSAWHYTWLMQFFDTDSVIKSVKNIMFSVLHNS